MGVMVIYKANKVTVHLSYQDVTLASQDGNWSILFEEGSG